MLFTLLKSSKQNCFSKFFYSNWNNIRNTLKEIKLLITSKYISTTVPSILNHNNSTLTNLVEIFSISNLLLRLRNQGLM